MEQIEPRPRAERTPSSVDITIDIKLRIFPNYINLMSKRVIPVAILTTEEFDTTAVDPETVVFAGASPLCWALKDVDDYDDMDMILHFKTQDADIE